MIRNEKIEANVLLIIISITFTVGCPRLDAQIGSWVRLENMQATRGKTSACYINGKIYIVGSGNTAEEYSPQTNSWRYVQKMPISRNGCAGCALNAFLYVTGGQTGSGQPGLTSMHRYSPLTDVWESVTADMPIGQYILELCACDGKLYAGLGLYHPKDLAEYDPATNTWSVIQDVPSLECTALCGYDGILYAFGSAQGLQKVYAYDPAKKTWSAKADMPTGRIGAKACCLNNLIYVIGGSQDPSYPWDGNQVVGVVEAYDPHNDVWHTGFEPMLTPRYFIGSCAVDSMIYAIGGKTKDGNCNLLEAYKPFYTEVKKLSAMVASQFILQQNYPNPFNPATTIEYSLPRASFVTLKVFDLLGREVRTLVQEQQAAGAHSVLFEAGELPSNIYFYKLEWDDAYEIRKMAVVR